MTQDVPRRESGAAPIDPVDAGSSPHPGARDAADVLSLVPRQLRVLAAIGWRLLVVAATLYLVGMVIAYLAAVVVPMAIALLLAALLAPAVGVLVRHRVPRGLATALVLVVGLAGLAGVLTFVVITFALGLPALESQLVISIDAAAHWLSTGPLHLTAEQVGGVRDSLLTALNANPAALAASALSTAATIGQTIAQIVLVLFTLVLFLHGGRGIWRFLVRAAAPQVRGRVDLAGRRAFTALVGYVRATVVVAVVDAIGIGIGLAIVGTPLAVPLAALVFLGAFVPVVGAVLAGGVAVLVALAAQGLVPALIIAAVVVGVMQLEGHVLQPLLMSRAVALHPLAVVLVIATGLLVAGIPGALLGVPLLAALNAGIRSLWSGLHDPVVPADGPELDAPGSETDGSRPRSLQSGV